MEFAIAICVEQLCLFVAHPFQGSDPFSICTIQISYLLFHLPLPVGPDADENGHFLLVFGHAK